MRFSARDVTRVAHPCDKLLDALTQMQTESQSERNTEHTRKARRKQLLTFG